MQPLKLPYPGLDLYPVLNIYPGHSNFMNKCHGEKILYHSSCQAGIEANNLAQSDSESAQWLWRNLTSSSGSARVSIKTTLTRVSDFLSSDATETSFIPLRSWRRAQQSPAIRFRIGAVVVEGYAIEFWDRQGTYKDNPHKGQRFHGFRCDRDVLYTAA